MTKKERLDPDDASMQKEHTIPLSKEEFLVLSSLDGKKLSKIRHYYDYNGIVAEIDVFQEYLKGLVVIDFEFQTVDEKDRFTMPDFCLADVTQDDFIAGGMLCGKKYKDIENELRKFNYKKIIPGKPE
jgi:CYTH domain-containing protein